LLADRTAEADDDKVLIRRLDDLNDRVGLERLKMTIFDNKVHLEVRLVILDPFSSRKVKKLRNTRHKGSVVYFMTLS